MRAHVLLEYQCNACKTTGPGPDVLMDHERVPEIDTNLGKLRRQRGFSAIHLAAAAGVSRQTIYAMEAGTYVPNTAVALRLARALDTTVEELFALADSAPAPNLRSDVSVLLPGSDRLQAGQAVQLCRVDKR